MSEINGAGNPSAQILQMERERTNEAQVNAVEKKAGAANINTSNGVITAPSTDPTAIKPQMTDHAILSQPDGDASFLGKIATTDLDSMINGLNAQSEDINTASRADEIKDTIKTQEETKTKKS